MTTQSNEIVKFLCNRAECTCPCGHTNRHGNSNFVKTMAAMN